MQEVSMATTVFGGWTPDQMRALDSMIYGPKIGLTRDRHPYVSGAVVVDHLNKITGWRWSSRVVQGPEFMPIKVVKTSGGDRATLTVWCIVRLTVVTPGGLVIEHDGFGAKTSYAKPGNEHQLFDNTPKMAKTYALRDAAIMLGDQFGLSVMRLKEHDEDGQAVDWRDQATGEQTIWPDLVSAAGGHAFRPRATEIPVDDFDGAAEPAGTGGEDTAPIGGREVLRERAARAFAVLHKAGRTDEATEISKKVLDDAGLNVPGLSAVRWTREQAEQNGADYVEDATVETLAEALEAAGGGK